jgi:hypothetical protein
MTDKDLCSVGVSTSSATYYMLPFNRSIRMTYASPTRAGASSSRNDIVPSAENRRFTSCGATRLEFDPNKIFPLGCWKTLRDVS